MSTRRAPLRAVLAPLGAGLARRWRHLTRHALRRDDGSIMLAMLVMITVTGVGMVVTPMFLLQVGTTRSDNARATQLTAARTGLDVAVGHLRAANDGAGNGVLAGLPCAVLAGTTTAGRSGQYAAAVAYYASDPSFRTATQLSSDAMTCVAGRGTAQTPGYALIVSQGTDAVAPAGTFAAGRTRTVRATYSFRASGGLIHSYPAAGSPDLCFDAGSAMPPTAGTALTMQTCQVGAGAQSFSYRPNLTLMLTASATGAQPNGMCLDAGAPHTAGAAVVLQPCGAATVANQQWSLDARNSFLGTADGRTPDGSCFVLNLPGVRGSTVAIQNTAVCSSPPSPTHSFVPDAAAGNGAAGADTGQLLDLGQSGRCLDVSNESVAAPWLITYSCKQSTNAVDVFWNQKWALPPLTSGAGTATGQISTSPPGAGAYCLRSPLASASGRYVTLLPCTTDPGLTWTRFGNTGRYATSYQITDGANLCLQPTDPTAVPADLDAGNSKIVVVSCNGSTLQKWNAPASVSRSGALTNVAEQ